MKFDTPQFFITADQPCSYLPERRAQNLLLDPQWPLDHSTYGQLVRQGFRRSGDHVYRPHCKGCKACVPIRVQVAKHRPNRNQRRTLRANLDLTLHSRPAHFCDEYFELFRRYLEARHSQSEMTDTHPEQFSEFLISRCCQTEFLEVREGGTLLAVAVTDHCPDGLSAVYTFFEPTLARRNLGRFCVLQQIQLAASRQLPYLYLGYWIAACPNMAYKAEYKPLEAYRFDHWEPLAAD